MLSLKESQEALIRKFREGGPNIHLLIELEKFTEERIEFLKKWFSKAPFEIYVTGSFGRGKPCLFSDLDLVFQIEEEKSKDDYAQWISQKIYPLYEVFRVVEYSFRNQHETEEWLKKDFRVYFTLREARHLYTGKLFQLPDKTIAPNEELLIHTRKRWDFHGNSPCLVELNLKESPGACLDYENYLRIEKHPSSHYQDNFNVVYLARNYLHALHLKKRDHLDFNIMNALPKEFIRKIYESTTSMYLNFEKIFDPHFDVHPINHLKEWFQLSSFSKRQFNRYYLSGSFRSLFPIMNDLLMQCSSSGVHRYTIGWHSSECLKVIKDVVAGVIEPAPRFLSTALAQVNQIEILNLALFLHDLGKGIGEDHSITGSQWVKEHLLDKLSDEEVELVSWLIQNHLEFHEKSIKGDIFSEDIIEKAVQWIGSEKRCGYLYLLTIVDLIGTNRKLWTEWRAQMLGNFFYRIMEKFSQRKTKKNKKFLDQTKNWDPALPDEYRLSRTPEDMKEDEKLFRQAIKSGHLELDLRNDPTVGFDVLIAATPQFPRRLHLTICETLFKSDIGVWRARTVSLKEGFLFFFWIYPYGSLQLQIQSRQAQSLKRNLKRTLQMESHESSQSKDMNEMKKKLESKIDGHIHTRTIESSDSVDLTINALDREGLLKDILGVIYEGGFSVDSALIGTTGVRALDHFVLK